MAELLSQQRKALCERCNSKVLDILLQARRDESPDIAALGRLGQIEEGGLCPICNLLSLAKPECATHHRDANYELHYSDEAGFQNKDSSMPHEWFLRKFFLSCTLCNNAWGRRNSSSQRYIATITKSSKDDSDPWVDGRHVNPASVDYGAMRAWLSKCDLLPECNIFRNTATIIPTGMRLIDCYSRRIVNAEPQWQYAALSYVWGLGHGTDDDGMTGERLPTSLLLTIEDTLTVTKELGLRYVWIDRYCIPRDNEALQHTQINHMDSIYRRSYVTIVAAAGNDPRYGLPGVSSTLRHERSQFQFGSKHILSFKRHPWAPVWSSTWATRAWTFQEYLFSSRRLFFTDEEVYYECQDAEAWESFPRRIHGRREGRFVLGSIEQDYRLGDNIHELLREYSQRSLTFDADAIRALAGVFHEFENADHPMKQFWGIPVIPFYLPVVGGEPMLQRRSLTKSFVSGLCWQSIQYGRRRAQFPSWSWAGWTSILDKHMECKLVANRDEQAHFGDQEWPKVFIEGEDGKLTNFEDGLQAYDWSQAQGYFIHLEILTIPLNIETHVQSEEWCVQNATKQSSEQPGLLESYATFENEEFVLRCPVVLNEKPLVESVQGKHTRSLLFREEIFGLLLGTLSIAGMFFLVVKREPDCFRRIGFMRVDDFATSVISRSSGQILEMTMKKKHYKNLCLRGKEMRKIRLG